MSRYLAISILVTTLSCFAHAQVSVNKPIVLEGLLPEQRQLTGLPAPTLPNSLTTAATEQAGTFRTVIPQEGNNWVVSVDGLVDAPVAGMHLLVVAPQTSSGPVEINVNGNGPYALLTGPGEPLDGGTVPAGSALSIVMDGTAFQVLNGSAYSRRPCPLGTVAVNSSFCVEPNEHPIANLFTAMTTCSDLGLRLCSWSEFLISCSRATELGMLQATDNWEWTNDASNENGSGRIVGTGSCLSAGNALVINSIDRAFRCCYSR